VAEWSKAHAC